MFVLGSTSGGVGAVSYTININGDLDNPDYLYKAPFPLSLTNLPSALAYTLSAASMDSNGLLSEFGNTITASLWPLLPPPVVFADVFPTYITYNWIPVVGAVSYTLFNVETMLHVSVSQNTYQLQDLEPNSAYLTSFTSVDRFGVSGEAAAYLFVTAPALNPNALNTQTIVIISIVGSIALISAAILLYFLTQRSAFY